MAVAFDAFTGSPSASYTTGTISFVHAPAGTPKGAFVNIWETLGLPDGVSAVTYAGVALSQIATVTHTFSTVALTTHLWGLTTTVPTGSATVVVTFSGASSAKRCGVLTVSAATAAVAVQAVPTLSHTGSASVTLLVSLGGNSCFVAETWVNDGNLATAVTPFTGWTATYEADMGTEIGGVYVYDTVGAVDVTAGYTTTVPEHALIAYAIKEVSAGVTITCGPAVITSVGGSGALLSPTNIAAAAGTVVLAGQQATIVERTEIACTAATIALTANYAVIDPESPVVGRPIDTVSNDSWQSSTGGRLYDAVDEVTADDSDYIYADPTGTAKLLLNNMPDPATSHGHAIYFQAWHPDADGWLNVILYQGVTQIAAYLGFFGTLPAAHTIYKFNLTEAQADSITDYNDLYLTFATIIGGAYVGWAEFRIEPTVAIECSPATIMVNGQQASIQEGAVPTSVECAAGTIVLAGQQASITESVKTAIECAAGTIVLTGQQASITETGAATAIECAFGLIALSGQQASITESVKTEVACTYGLITLTGQQATVTEFIPVPTTVECTFGLIVVVGGTATIEAASALRGRPRRKYVTYVEPTAPEESGTPPTNYGAAFGSLAPMLPPLAITPPLASARPKLKLLKPAKWGPAPLPFADEPLPTPPPQLRVIEGRGHVKEALPTPVVDRVASALEQLAATIRHDPNAARQVTEALLPLLLAPEGEDEEAIIEKLLLAGPRFAQQVTDALLPMLTVPAEEEEEIIRLLLQRGAA